MGEGKIVRKGGGSVAIPTGAYVEATGGITLEYDLDGKRYRSHTFNSSGLFEVTQLSSNPLLNEVDFLVIGGGGGGGAISSIPGGGGGAGGYRTSLGTSGGNVSQEPKILLDRQLYNVTVGAGGNTNANGNDSRFDYIVSKGGGRGGRWAGVAGANGGSGGGGASVNTSAEVAGGKSVFFQGFDGGKRESSNNRAGAGGGGAGAPGANSLTGQAGNGGNGLSNILRTGSAETRGGGGGGGAHPNETRGLGGTGGGGNGTSYNGANATAGEANTGGGGGGHVSSNQPNIPGGSGIVIIRYEIAPSV